MNENTTHTTNTMATTGQLDGVSVDKGLFYNDLLSQTNDLVDLSEDLECLKIYVRDQLKEEVINLERHVEILKFLLNDDIETILSNINESIKLSNVEKQKMRTQNRHLKSEIRSLKKKMEKLILQTMKSQETNEMIENELIKRKNELSIMIENEQNNIINNDKLPLILSFENASKDEFGNILNHIDASKNENNEFGIDLMNEENCQLMLNLQENLLNNFENLTKEKEKEYEMYLNKKKELIEKNEKMEKKVRCQESLLATQWKNNNKNSENKNDESKDEKNNNSNNPNDNIMIESLKKEISTIERLSNIQSLTLDCNKLTMDVQMGNCVYSIVIVFEMNNLLKMINIKSINIFPQNCDEINKTPFIDDIVSKSILTNVNFKHKRLSSVSNANSNDNSNDNKDSESENESDELLEQERISLSKCVEMLLLRLYCLNERFNDINKLKEKYQCLYETTEDEMIVTFKFDKFNQFSCVIALSWNYPKIRNSLNNNQQSNFIQMQFTSNDEMTNQMNNEMNNAKRNEKWQEIFHQIECEMQGKYQTDLNAFVDTVYEKLKKLWMKIKQ